MDYRIIYSSRKTLALAIKDGEVIVRAPYKYPKSKIENAVKEREGWINKHLPASIRKTEAQNALTTADIKRLKAEALSYFSEKCEHFARIMGAKYNSITVTGRKTYGSCTSKRDLFFSYKLMLFPEAAREYVVVHELAHLFEMNHSRRFYDIVARYMPDYKERNKLLKFGALLPEYLN